MYVYKLSHRHTFTVCVFIKNMNLPVVKMTNLNVIQNLRNYASGKEELESSSFIWLIKNSCLWLLTGKV